MKMFSILGVGKSSSTTWSNFLWSNFNQPNYTSNRVWAYPI